MATPLYKFLKTTGFSTYVFPSASEDISASYQNDNYKLNFSKFSLLNIDLNKTDLQTNFNTESFNPISNKGDELINSLRNYVANQEETIKTSKISNNQNFYNPNILSTTTEKIFWKWLRKTDAIQFEAALPNDEYIDTKEFSIDENLSVDYFKEYLWKERQSKLFNLVNIEDTGIKMPNPLNNDNNDTVYKITLGSDTNIKPGDYVYVTSTGVVDIGFSGQGRYYVNDVLDDFDPANGNTTKNYWVYIISKDILIWNNFAVASMQLDYTRVVQYLGEISSINNVTESDSSWTEVLAFLPDQTGQTPEILFRVKYDDNYGPGNQYPILPSQDQPEIIGGELNDNPIVTHPEMFPGDQYALFDRDQKYINSDGFQDRKRGSYFGIPTETNRRLDRVVSSPYVYPEFDGINIDGINIDFDSTHYVKMNLPTKVSNNFDQFNSESFNSMPPADFKFNVILWYYQVEDKFLSPTTTTVSTDLTTDTIANVTKVTSTVTTQSTTNNQTLNTAMNLYAITFLNPVTTYTSNNDLLYKIQTYDKLVATSKQDGLSYQFTLNLNFNISNDNIQPTYNPEKTYSLYNFDLFNKAMTQLTESVTLMQHLSYDVSGFQTQLTQIKQLIYTQTDIRTINSRIDNLHKLLTLYQRNQIVDSETIKVNLLQTTNPPSIQLISTDSRFGQIFNLLTKTLYNTQNNTVNDYKITIPRNKDFIINVINNDDSDIILDRPLNIVLDRDLDYKQSCIINLYGNNAKLNKKLNISILTKYIKTVDPIKGFQLFNKPQDLPIDLNLNVNIATNGIIKRWTSIPDKIYPHSNNGSGVSIKKVSDNYYISIELKPYIASSFKNGDVITIENFLLSFQNLSLDISGQYTISSDISNNQLTIQLPFLGTSLETLYTNVVNVNISTIANVYTIPDSYFTQPFGISINVGKTITITSINNNATTIGDVYLIQIDKLKKELISE